MKKLSLCALALVLSSCASVVSGARQNVTVITPDVEGAACSLADSKGRTWYIEETPGTALVKRGDGPISVICNKDGYKKGVALLEEQIAGANYGNLALGPIAPIGYVIDGMGGAAQKYKDSVNVYLDPVAKKEPWETSYDY